MGKVEKVFVRSEFNYDMNEASDQSGLECRDPSRTSQEFADETNINTIVNKFLKTGELPASFKAPSFGDFSDVDDYQSSLNAVIAANDAFMQMPAGMRARFHNNPQNLLEFLSNEDNREEAERMGLLRGREAPVVVSPTPPVSPSGDSVSAPPTGSK